MVIPDWVSVIEKYNGMCEKPFTKKQIQNMLTYRKRNNLLQEWLELKIAYDMWVVNNDWKKDSEILKVVEETMSELRKVTM